MLAVIELRGGHVPLLQKSELAPPAAHVAGPAIAAPTPKVSSADLDTTPTGAIPASASAAKAPPADLAAAIPTGLPQALARRRRRRRRRAPNSNSPCVCSTAAASRAIRTPPRNGSSRRRPAACRSPNTASPRSTRRASA